MNIIDNPAKKELKLAGGKVICSSRSLAKALQPMLMVVNSSTVLPILEDVLIELVKSEVENYYKMKLTVTDLESVWSTYLDVDCKKEFSFCVDLKLLYKFCSEIPDQPIVLAYAASEGRLEITTDDMTVHMPTEDTDLFPKIPVIESLVYAWKPGYSLLVPQLSNALKFVSKDELRPAMTGVYIHDNKGLTIAATDAHQLYWDKIIEKTPEGMKGFAKILPAKPCRIIAKWFKKGEDIEIAADDLRIQFKSQNITFITRHIEARYPDYEVVIPQPDTQLYFRRKDLRACLKIAMLFSNKSTNQLELHITHNTAEAKSQDVDFSYGMKSRVNVYDCNNPAIDFTFAVNAKFVLQMLDVVKDEFVKLMTTEVKNKAMIFDDCILIMPLMLNQ